jgi:cytochrome oxidase Cu insertion factor (SCO1/SenC/PrrC family)
MDGGDWDSVKTFGNEFGISYPILQGDDDVSQKYMVRTIPLFILLDREGNIRHRFLGAGNEEEIEKEIKALLGA